MSSTDAPPRRSSAILPLLPDISTTISNILSGSSQTHERDKTVDVRSPTPSLGLASFTPNMMTSWFRKPTSTRSTTTSPVAEHDSDHDPSGTNDQSCATSQSDSGPDTTAASKKRRRCARPKTSYSLCHAPPRSGQRHKIKVRARPLLQLHKQESRARPRPAFELLPSAIFSPRLVKAIARFSTSRLGMSPTDLAIVRAEDYHRHESSPDTDDETHDILALICGAARGASGRARICLEGGVEWEAYQLPSGGYECTTTDDHGLRTTVRWVLKRGNKGAITSPITSPITSSTVTSPTSILSPTDSIADASETRRFNFSTISANTRRHPVIANLTAESLDISDLYSVPLPSDSVDGVPPLDRHQSDDSTERAEDTVSTTEGLRGLITATAIFVAVAEGWCTNYRGEDSVTRSASTKSTSPVKSLNPRHHRTSSFDADKRRSGSLRAALRSPTMRRNGSVAEETSSCSSSVFESSTVPPIPEHRSTPRRRRADTTATVIVHGDAQWRPAYDDETEDEVDLDDVKSTKSSPVLDGRRSVSAQTLDGRLPSTVPESTTVPAPIGADVREKKFSTASTVVGGQDHASYEKTGRTQKQKKSLVGRLLCGMI